MRWSSIRHVRAVAAAKREVDIRKWHPWFACHPVRIWDTVVWLEPIERRRCNGWSGDWWDHRYTHEPK